MNMQYIIMDLEMNPVSNRNRDARSRLHREIIEIGAVKLDEDHNVVDKFRCYVKPQFNSEITPFITSLTGITSYEVCGACCFADALFAFEKWIGYDKPSKVYSWSFSDLEQLSIECDYKQVKLPENMNNWVDFQAVYAEAMEYPSECGQMSLHAAAEQFGILMDSKTSHSALYDAEITAELIVPVLSGEYKHQVELLKKSVLKENEHKGFCLGDSCGGVLQQLLQQMSEKQNYAFAR